MDITQKKRSRIVNLLESSALGARKLKKNVRFTIKVSDGF